MRKKKNRIIKIIIGIIIVIIAFLTANYFIHKYDCCSCCNKGETCIDMCCKCKGALFK